MMIIFFNDRCHQNSSFEIIMNYYYRFSLIVIFSLFMAVGVFNFEIFREEEVFSSVRDISIDED